MPNAPIYLDYNATAPLRPEAISAMQEIMTFPANPSSVHVYGREAKKHLEAARSIIAESVSAFANEVTFTASGSEANATALRGFKNRRIFTSATEHSSVLHYADDTIAVDTNGMVQHDALRELLKNEHRPALVSVMLANNETGVIQPMREIAAICKEYNAVLHCDAVQALGKIPVDIGTLGADMLTLSAHKCGGPVGAAALIVRQNIAFDALIKGGGQELGKRAGTENLAAIAGFAAAVQAASQQTAHIKQQREQLKPLEQLCHALGGTVAGCETERLPNTSCIIMPGIGSEVQLMNLDLAGFAVSAGSACSSGRIAQSHVLKAMGFSGDDAASALRISCGWNTKNDEIEAFTKAWGAMCERLGQKRGHQAKAATN